MEKTLNELPIDCKGTIKPLEISGTMRRRLLDLGLVKGTTIIPVLESPSKGLRAFYIRGSLIAIRNEDSSLIKVLF